MYAFIFTQSFNDGFSGFLFTSPLVQKIKLANVYAIIVNIKKTIISSIGFAKAAGRMPTKFNAIKPARGMRIKVSRR